MKISLQKTSILFYTVCVSFFSFEQTLFYSKNVSGSQNSIIKIADCDTTTVYHGEVNHPQYSYNGLRPFAVIDENNLLIPVYNNNAFNSIIYKWNIPNQTLDSIGSLYGAVTAVQTNEYSGVISFYNGSNGYLFHLNADLTENVSMPINGQIVSFFDNTNSKILQFSNSVLAKADNYRIYKGILSSGGVAELPNFFEADKIVRGFVKINDVEAIIVSFKNNSTPSLQKFYINKYNVFSNSHVLIDSIPYSSPSFNNFYNAQKFYFGGVDSIYFFNNNYGANLVGQISVYNFGSKTTSSLYSYNTMNEQFKDAIYNQGKLLSYNSYLDIGNPISTLSMCNSEPNTNLRNLKCFGCIQPNSSLGTNDIKNHLFSIHPNPATNQVIISSQFFTENKAVQIFNTAGQLVHEYPNLSPQDQTYTINVEQLNSGIYFIKIGESTQKLIIQ